MFSQAYNRSSDDYVNFERGKVTLARVCILLRSVSYFLMSCLIYALAVSICMGWVGGCRMPWGEVELNPRSEFNPNSNSNLAHNTSNHFTKLPSSFNLRVARNYFKSKIKLPVLYSSIFGTTLLAIFQFTKTLERYTIHCEVFFVNYTPLVIVVCFIIDREAVKFGW